MQLSVLLVEDVPTQATIIESFLQVSLPEAKLTLKGDLASALDALENEVFDIVLLDLGLPDADGLEVVFQVRDASQDTPIVVLTAQGEEGLGTLCIQSGAQDFLSKQEMDPDRLAKTINYAAMRRSESAIMVLNQVLSQLSVLGEGQDDKALEEFDDVYSDFVRDSSLVMGAMHQDFVSTLAREGANPRGLIALHSRCLKNLCRDSDERDKNNYIANSSSVVLATMTLLAEAYQGA